MLIEPELTLPPLDDGRRLFICVGDPWDQALRDVRAGRADSTFLWNVGRSYKKSDWILTYLGTRPRVFLCWEQATRDATPNGKLWVDHETAVYFSNLVVVDDIERQTGLKIAPKAQFGGPEAQSIRHELITRLWYPTTWHGLDGKVTGADIADY
ncbi:hypothetical protein DVG80_18275 [Rhodococcus erythropolis]|nr:hypothetical protein DVG80_18275 [Rhodococcus erythropolis]